MNRNNAAFLAHQVRAAGCLLALLTLAAFAPPQTTPKVLNTYRNKAIVISSAAPISTPLGAKAPNGFLGRTAAFRKREMSVMVTLARPLSEAEVLRFTETKSSVQVTCATITMYDANGTLMAMGEKCTLAPAKKK
ncbi:hypothetical protein [Hymenobacter radiodurans]|uniref:hypothetical protein n=1 Tax=Hymenobacter radiodurans TaxID=2496028 RepID=UPI001058CC50|nr:hypothetical protein [Hymenobacter radiodurans]